MTERKSWSGISNNGLECPRCGCRHFLTAETERIPNAIRRTRVCRNCRWSIRTKETIQRQT